MFADAHFSGLGYLWYTSSEKYDAKHMFSYLDFRCYFEANGQNHIHTGS